MEWEGTVYQRLLPRPGPHSGRWQIEAWDTPIKTSSHSHVRGSCLAPPRGGAYGPMARFDFLLTHEPTSRLVPVGWLTASSLLPSLALSRILASPGHQGDGSRITVSAFTGNISALAYHGPESDGLPFPGSEQAWVEIGFSCGGRRRASGG